MQPTAARKDNWLNSQAWIERPLEYWAECRGRFGPTFEVDLGSIGPCILFCRPSSVQQVFALPADSYLCGPYNAHYREIMGDLSILAMDGAAHREQRRLILPALAPDSLTHCFDSLPDIIARHLGALQDNAIIDLRPTIHEMAFEIMLYVLLGKRSTELAKLLRNVFLKDLIKDYGSWSPWARFTKWHPLLRKTIAAECQQLRKNQSAATHYICSNRAPTSQKSESGGSNCQNPDFPERDPAGLLESLANYRDESGQVLNDNQIADHVFTMLIAGVDTSAIATLWAIFLIADHPEVFARLLVELNQTSGRSVSRSSAVSGELPYLAAACKESLRMIPVVTTPTGRKLLKPVTIDGREYPPGVTLIPCTYLVHRDPELFPQPDKFQPDRFLTRTYKTYEYFPFGGKHRICPGAKLATASMQAILLQLISRFDIRSASEGEIRAIRHGTLLAPSLNLRFEVCRRAGELQQGVSG